MKNTLIIIIVTLLLSATSSCGTKMTEISKTKSPKKIETVKDLKEKYANKKFKDCDEFLAAADEAYALYFEIIEKAVIGDKKAKKELAEIENFLEKSFGVKGQIFKKECPEKFAKWEEKYTEKLAEVMPQLEKLYNEQLEDDNDDTNESLGDSDEDLDKLIDDDEYEIDDALRELY